MEAGYGPVPLQLGGMAGPCTGPDMPVYHVAHRPLASASGARRCPPPAMVVSASLLCGSHCVSECRVKRPETQKRDSNPGLGAVRAAVWMQSLGAMRAWQWQQQTEGIVCCGSARWHNIKPLMAEEQRHFSYDIFKVCHTMHNFMHGITSESIRSQVYISHDLGCDGINHMISCTKS